MKKVFTWVASSFFRQFGRFLFFLVLGGLVVLLIQHNDINFKWTDLLGIETIDALTYTTEVQVKSSSYFDIRNASSFTCNTWDSCEWELVSSDSSPINSKQIQINSNYNTRDKDFIAFQILLSQPVQITNVAQGIQMYCTNWTQNGNSYYCSNTSSVTNGSPIIQESILSDINFNIKANYTNNTSAFCDINGNQIICPTFKNQIDNVEVTWNFKTHYTSYALFRFYKIANNIYYSNPTNAIESQTQQQQQQHNETISIINDTNTTNDVNGTTNFFNDTNITVENSLTSIVSSPLNLINSLIVGDYNQLCATLNGKQICLPSGAIIWNRTETPGQGVHDNASWFRGGTVTAFIEFFNLVVGGYILYRCLISLFHSIHRLLDPASSYVEVMKL